MTGLRVYFGGTFDPPHRGHDLMLRALLEDPWVHHVHVVPTGQNPLKLSVEHLGDPQQRLEWIRVWLRCLEQQEQRWSLETCEIEAGAEQASYTLDTLSKLQAQSPQEPWVLCVGGDIPVHFHRWKNIEELLARLHSVWVFPRGEQIDPLEGMEERLRSLCEFRWMAPRIPAIASTRVREAFQSATAQTSKHLEQWLLPEVLRAVRGDIS